MRSITFAAIVLSLAVIARPASAADDPQSMSGTWLGNVNVQGHQLPFLSVHDGAKYSNYLTLPSGDVLVGAGTIQAFDGKWSTTPTRGPADSGTYRWINENIVEMTGSSGAPVTWTRISDQATQPKAPARPELPAGVNLRSVKVSQVAAAAHQWATWWHKDACLVSARALHPSPDGSVDLLLDPTGISLQYYSPSTNQGLIIDTSRPAGMLFTSSVRQAPGPFLLPVSRQALDLTDALDAARAQGFKDEVDRAELNVWSRQGKPPRIVWVLYTSSDPCVVSAASGALLDRREVMDDAAADYNRMAAPTQQATSTAVGQVLIPLPQNTAATNSGYDASSVSFSTPPWGDDSAASFNLNQQRYWNGASARNAWESSDAQAQGRSNSSVATDEDTSNYSQ